MIDKRLFGLWLILLIVSAILVLCIRFIRTSKWSLSLKEVIDLALSGVATGLTGGHLIFQVWFKYEALQKLVGLEGVVAMVLGSFASIWFGIGKIHELAVKEPS